MRPERQKMERWKRVEELFHAALEREPEQRAAFLNEACDGDLSLRKEVESLLLSDGQAADFIESPAVAKLEELIAQDEGQSLVGQQISHYKVIKELGRGGMGIVYLAQDMHHWNRQVALKLLLPKYTNNNEHVRRFRQEAYAASQRNHPNIPHVYEIGRIGSTYFIASEFVEGVTLRECLADAPMELEQALDVAIKVADALGKAHAAGIIHRDIKPENIMRDAEGHIKVLDFGLAKLIEPRIKQATDSDSPTIPQVKTAPGMFIGTIGYMSPEQLRGQDVDERTDVWSVGVVLYEMITGRAPFERKTDSDVIAAILNQEPAPVVRYLPESPAELQRIVTKALRKKKEERYQTIKDLLLDLENLKQDRAFQARLNQSTSSDLTGTTDSRRYKRQGDAEPEQEDVTVRTPWLEHLRSITGRYKFITVVTLLIFIGGVTFGLYKILRQPDSTQSVPPPFQNYEVSVIPHTEKVRTSAAVSPDGEYVALVEVDGKYQSIWVKRRINAGEEQKDEPGQVVPPAEVRYYGLIFSHDGNDLYYVRLVGCCGTLYRVNLRDGRSVKLVEDIDSPITLSPDGRQLAFWRQYFSPERDAMVVANAIKGGEEREIIVRKRPDFLSKGGFAWSPDGRTIACGFGSYMTGGYLKLVAVQVDDGKAREITPQEWWDVQEITWLKDGNGLFITATPKGVGSRNNQLWFVPYPSGEPRQITHDVSNYIGVSLTGDSQTLVTVQSNRVSDFYQVPNGDARLAEKITSGTFPGYDLSLTPDGRIVFVAKTRGSRGVNEEIWIMGADGKDVKQLTHNASDDYSPSVCGDRYIVFVSNRSPQGTFNLWRIDLDGSNPRQLTKGFKEIDPHCSPDGRWVIYESSDSGKMSLWRVSIEGGEVEQVTDQVAHSPAISPDGKWIAFVYKESEARNSSDWVAGVIPVGGGQPRKIANSGLHELQWRDKDTLTYVETSGEVSNIWSQPLDGSPLKQLTHFKELRIYSYGWSADGRVLTCERGKAIRRAVQLVNSR